MLISRGSKVVQLFLGAIHPLLRDLDFALSSMTLEDGVELYAQGDANAFVYIVLSGRVYGNFDTTLDPFRTHSSINRSWLHATPRARRALCSAWCHAYQGLQSDGVPNPVLQALGALRPGLRTEQHRGRVREARCDCAVAMLWLWLWLCCDSDSTVTLL